jgi:uronate dehydrogenase
MERNRINRPLITGAADGLGRIARARLGYLARAIRLSDIVDLAPGHSGEEVVRCELADFGAVRVIVQGCDGILHLGGVSFEDTFYNFPRSNISEFKRP